MSRRAAIVAPVRTPVGRFLGALASVSAADLATLVTRATVERSGIDPAMVEEVILSQSYPNSEAPCIGRWAALAAGLPLETAGIQIDRRCGGGLQAVATAVMMVETGAADVVVAGGVESMSNIEFYSTAMRTGARMGTVPFYDRLDRGRERTQPFERFGRISGMIETAENVAREHSITREAADLFAVESQRRAAAAQAAGKFAKEIVPVPIPAKRGRAQIFAADEAIRGDTTIEGLTSLQPLTPNGVVTAGNACSQGDAAAACLVVAEDRLNELGLTPLAFVRGWAAVGCHPATMGMGPVPAVAKLLARTGVTFEKIDLVEVNEAFAVQLLAVCKTWGMDDHTRLNVNGSGISLGHPIGATGVRILTTLLNEMQRRNARFGLETMCIGGGQGIAALFERP
jgi:acetyl-CoA C-acetyltransferase